MRRSVAEMIVRDPEKYAHHDRVFLNNPVVMQGMGLAPLVVLATTGKNALMLAVSVALLLTPSRMLACLLSRAFPLRDEQPAKEELEKKLLPRGLIYSGSAAVVYLAVYPILNALFGVDLLALGIYLPMLVVEPLLIYRFGRVQETMHKAVSKGLRITLGYVLLLLLGAASLLPVAAGYPQRVTDILYDPVQYARLTPQGALERLSPLLFFNPAAGLYCLLESQTQILHASLYHGWGRLYATYLLLKKIGLEATAFLSLGALLLGAGALTGFSALLLRPRAPHRKRKKS